MFVGHIKFDDNDLRAYIPHGKRSHWHRRIATVSWRVIYLIAFVGTTLPNLLISSILVETRRTAYL